MRRPEPCAGAKGPDPHQVRLQELRASARDAVGFFALSPVGEGGSPHSGETGEGFLSARDTAPEFADANPPPRACAPLLPQGEKEKRLIPLHEFRECIRMVRVPA